MGMKQVRTLVILLGDQLDLDASVLRTFDPKQDVIWMAEVSEESTHVWTHKQKIVLFLSAMRHFKEALLDRGYRVDYTELSTDAECSFSDVLSDSIRRLQPKTVQCMRPGEWRVLDLIAVSYTHLRAHETV